MAVQPQIGIDIGGRIGAEVGRIEALQRAAEREVLCRRHIGLSAQRQIAGAGAQSGLTQLQPAVRQLRIELQPQPVLAQRCAQRLRCSSMAEHDVAGDVGALHAAIDRLQVDAIGVQHKFGSGTVATAVATAATEIAVTGEFAGGTEIDQHRTDLQRIETAAELRAGAA